MKVKLSSLSKELQEKIIVEIKDTPLTECLCSSSATALPIIESKVLKSFIRDYLLTTNLNLTSEEEKGIASGDYSGLFVKSSPGRRYEVLLVKSNHLPRIKRSLLNYIEAERSRADFVDKAAFNATLDAISSFIPVKKRILCSRHGVNFLAKYHTPLTTNLGRTSPCI